jgi:hypothetical protein
MAEADPAAANICLLVINVVSFDTRVQIGLHYRLFSG